MGKKKQVDEAWEHGEKIGNNRLHIKCNYCKGEFWGGISRFKHHLGGSNKNVRACTKAPKQVKDFYNEVIMGNVDEEVEIYECGEDVDIGKKRKMMQDAMGPLGTLSRDKTRRGATLNTFFKKPDRDRVCQAICQCLYANALPFNLVKSPYFKKMLSVVGEFGKGLKPPSYHEARVTFLEKEVKAIKASLEKNFKQEWKKMGCTLMSDGWTDGKYRSITNFLVNSPKGTVFLKSIDTSDIHHSGDNLFELLDSVVEYIGEEHVVQVVTDGASAYVKAGQLLMEKRKKLFWSPCAAHVIDLILHDIGDLSIQKDTMEKARKVTTYIYRHVFVLNLMRKHTKGRELIRAGVTRFATNYLTLKSLQTSKIGLRKMFASEAWQKSPYSHKPDGNKVAEIILGTESFWPSIKYCLKCVIPIVKVLRLVDGDDKPAMGYIYEAMDKAKEQIARNFKNVKKRYENVWSIIDLRWDRQLHGPLHAAGYFLNPKYHYSPDFIEDYEIKKGLLDTIERMCPSMEERLKVDKQIEMFRKAEGLFGHTMAIETRDKKQPALWWDAYGNSCPELQRIAIRILSATCSATGCERNWSVFDHVHSKKRNRLEQARMNMLVFVKYNLQLEARHQKRLVQGDTYDPICLSDLESDDEWITEVEDPVMPLDDHSWLDANECFEIQEVGSTSTTKKKRVPRDLRAKKLPQSQTQLQGKGKKVVNEDEDEDEETDEEEGGKEEERMEALSDDDDILDDLLDMEP